MFTVKRLVYGFFSLEDLERLLFLRQYRKPLSSIAIDNAITDLAYQHEAICRVCEAFDAGKTRQECQKWVRKTLDRIDDVLTYADTRFNM